MAALIGIIMFYTWIHSTIIILTKLFKKLDTYEKIVMVVGFTGFILYIIGTINN